MRSIASGRSARIAACSVSKYARRMLSSCGSTSMIRVMTVSVPGRGRRGKRITPGPSAVPCSTHGTRTVQRPARGLGARARHRGAPRRHGVRRGRRGGPLDRTGQEHRLLHGDQRRGRHRRHAARRVPRRPRGRADRLGERGRRLPGRLPRLPGRRHRVRRAAAPRDRPGGPRLPARHRDHRQLPRHLGRHQPQPGRPHRRRAGPSSTRSATRATAGSSTTSSPATSSPGAA